MTQSRSLITTFANSPTLENARLLISHFRKHEAPEEIADLAVQLAGSGRRVQLKDQQTADLASTGGPSSLSTLITPLFLGAMGFTVPKLGIQGRPAGGIDVMAQLPSYNYVPSEEELGGILQRCRFAHFLADEQFAPLDQKLFSYRQIDRAQNVRSLVIASILAKKIAVGVQNVGLDVRIFPGGNFGEDFPTGLANAELFNATAKVLGLHSSCIVTDGTVPYQPYIGRREALVAIDRILADLKDIWIQGHSDDCARYALYIKNGSLTVLDNRSSILAAARAHFFAHITAHGSTEREFRRIVDDYDADPVTFLEAKNDGFPVYNLAAIRDVICSLQNASTASRFPDPVGVVLLAPPWEHLVSGAPLIAVRGVETGIFRERQDMLCRVLQEPSQKRKTVFC